jgi:hypothetical protein
MKEQMTRWTVVVDKELDIYLRSFLAENGGKKGDLSAFIKTAVRDALVTQIAAESHARNRDLTAETAEALVDAELADFRKDYWKDRKWWTD